MPILIFTALLLISSMLRQNIALAETITINNVTGDFKNATGTIIIKDISQVTNSTTLLKRILSQMSNEITKGEIKSIDTNQIHWWQYNAGSKLAP
jgi:ABC-type long-subunit fatty acid transport system fused permease/ATPase subunit